MNSPVVEPLNNNRTKLQLKDWIGNAVWSTVQTLTKTNALPVKLIDFLI